MSAPSGLPSGEQAGDIPVYDVLPAGRPARDSSRFFTLSTPAQDMNCHPTVIKNYLQLMKTTLSMSSIKVDMRQNGVKSAVYHAYILIIP